MAADSALQLIRAAKAQQADDRIPPIAVTATLLPGFTPDDDRVMFEPAVVLTPSAHPLLEAHLEVAGATRRGRMSWSVGLGDEYTSRPVTAIMEHVECGTIFPDELTFTTKKPIKLDGVQPGMKRQHMAAILAHLPYGRNHDLDRVGAWYPGNGGAKYGAVTLSIGGNVLWIKVITHELVTPDDAQLPGFSLNLRPGGRPFRDPKPQRVIDAIAVLDWLAAVGVAIVDPDETRPIARLRQRVSRSVIALPTAGQPAIAELSIGRDVFAQTGKVNLLGAEKPAREYAATRSKAPAVDVAGSLDPYQGVQRIIHPGIADVARMARAQPVTDDPRLRDYQAQAVGIHQETGIGYLLAAAPGMGKTVIQYSGMRRRAKSRDRYRALVVCESNVRAQWVAEAETWFPEAAVVQVESRSDAPDVALALTATDGPVVIVVSYALLASVTDEIGVREHPIEPAGEKPPPGREEVTPQPADLDLYAVTDGQLNLFDILIPELPQAATGQDEPGADQADDAQPDLWPSLGACLIDTRWDDLVADEAEVLRSTASKQADAMWTLREKSQVAVALTGTPINRGIDDLGRLISWTRGDPHLFRGVRLSKQFNLDDDDDLARFAEAMGPLIFRRDSSEIEDELPNITPTVMVLHPTPAEKALAGAAQHELKRVYTELLAWLDMVEKTDPGNEQYAQVRAGLRAARGAWLGGTTLARMAASDPAALIGSSSSGAALLAAQGLIEAANEHAGTKRTNVVKMVADRVAAGRQVLIFTEFATVARGLIDDLDASGIRVGEVLGGGGRKRDRMIAEFQDGKRDVLVCTSSGERGLNLQQASVIVHYDLPWTPKGVIQRTGRVMRIGSKNQAVEVIFPLMEGTIEEPVAELVVARAVEAMRALDASRGVDTSRTEMGLALGGLATGLSEAKHGSGSALMEMTQALVA